MGLQVRRRAVRPSSGLGQLSAVLGRCLELGSLPALNCGRLVTWHRERHAINIGRDQYLHSRMFRRCRPYTIRRAPYCRVSTLEWRIGYRGCAAAGGGAALPLARPLARCSCQASFFSLTVHAP
eukprot:6961374-Prymnesium_polylepis.1